MDGDEDDVPGVYEQQTMVALSIYSFMDNLFSAIRNSDGNQTTTAEPAVSDSSHTDVKPGGYPEELFIYLSEKEKEECECTICYNILKNPHQCKNGHKFCLGCIVVWCKQNGQSSDFCPVCRTEGLYAKNDSLNDKITQKRVKCSESCCNWRGNLVNMEEHEHRMYDLKEIYSEKELPSTSSLTSKIDKKTPQTLSDISPLPLDQRMTSSQVIQANSAAPSEAVSSSVDTRLPAANSNARRPSVAARRSSDSRPSLSRNSSQQTISGANSRRNSRSTTNNTNESTLTPHPPAGPRPRNTRPVRTVQRVNNSSTTNEVAALPSAAPEPVTPATTSANASATSVSDMPVSSQTHEAANTTSEVVPQPSVVSSTASANQPPTLEYKRLVNRPRQRPNTLATRLNQSREQLAVLMTLLTIELDERRRAVERYQIENQNRERRRVEQLVEVQSLNRRLHQVASNLGRIVDSDVAGSSSTSRPGLGPPFGDDTDDDSD